jgi:hypothetical protein
MKENKVGAVIPVQCLKPANTNVVWADDQAQLRKAGVKDPVLPKNPAYCALGDTTDVPGAAN